MHQPIQRTRWHYVMKTLKRSKRVPAQARVTAQCRRSGCTNVRGSKRACCTRSPCSCSYCISRSCLHELQLQRYSWRKVCPTIAELAVSKKRSQKYRMQHRRIQSQLSKQLHHACLHTNGVTRLLRGIDHTIRLRNQGLQRLSSFVL